MDRWLKLFGAKPEDKWTEHSIQVPIYYEDTDLSGFVYHANYLKFFERGREELIGRRYLRELFQTGMHYVVARIHVSYHAPSGHGDVLEITTRMRVSESPVLLCEQIAYKIRDESSLPRANAKLATAVVKLVLVDSKGETLRDSSVALQALSRETST